MLLRHHLFPQLDNMELDVGADADSDDEADVMDAVGYVFVSLTGLVAILF